MFARFASAVARYFGSAPTFFVTVVVIAVWLAPMTWQGWSTWNSGIGLAGNTTESTLELLAAITIQYIANRVEKGQNAQMAELQAANARIEQLEQTIASDVAEELTLLRQALERLAAGVPE